MPAPFEMDQSHNLDKTTDVEAVRRRIKAAIGSHLSGRQRLSESRGMLVFKATPL
jgi:hypothetical protein